MKIFSERSECPKCGRTGCASKFEGSHKYGVIKRICPRCGYSWSEKPLDSEDADHE